MNAINVENYPFDAFAYVAESGCGFDGKLASSPSSFYAQQPLHWISAAVIRTLSR